MSYADMQAAQDRKRQTKLNKYRAAAKLRLPFLQELAAKLGIEHYRKVQAGGFVYCHSVKRWVFLIDNRFIFEPGHPTARELSVRDLGGRACNCIKAFQAVRQCKVSDAPLTLYAAVHDARLRREARRGPREIRDHFAKLCSKEEWYKFKLLLKHKSNCTIPKQPDFQLNMGRTQNLAFIGGSMPNLKDRHGPVKPYVTINLNTNWKHVISKSNLTSVDGYVVIDIVELLEEPFVHANNLPFERAQAAVKRVMSAHRDTLLVLVAKENVVSGKAYISNAVAKIQFIMGNPSRIQVLDHVNG